MQTQNTEPSNTIPLSILFGCLPLLGSVGDGGVVLWGIDIYQEERFMTEDQNKSSEQSEQQYASQEDVAAVNRYLAETDRPGESYEWSNESLKRGKEESESDD